VLGWLEQQQQQRPGQPPLINRSASTRRLLQAGLSCKPSPGYESLQAWQSALAGKRAAAPDQRLFLDDLADQLLVASDGQRQLAYPYADVLGCVEGLFMSGSSSAAAWRAKLALLLYFLLDGGWLAGAAPFAHVSCRQAVNASTQLNSVCSTINHMFSSYCFLCPNSSDVAWVLLCVVVYKQQLLSSAFSCSCPW
jgi:hypothetical protein